ncbi:MAG: hypothetical protein GY854_04490 [Deltaproteobacteria bacterium]|nr:hypothetical protein [Deltaproteobacteria bacterium]
MMPGTTAGGGPSTTTSANSSLSKNSAISATASQGSAYSPDSAGDLSNGTGLGTGYSTGAASLADWKSTMRPVSFKGITFPATQVKNSSGRKLVKHVYPYRPGQELVDLGRQAMTINVSAVFCTDPFLTKVFGNLYPGRYESLLAAINDGESGELVHPVFGTLRAACESYSDTTQTSEINTVRLELTFVEDDISGSLPFSGVSAIDKAKKSAGDLDAKVAS